MNFARIYFYAFDSTILALGDEPPSPIELPISTLLKYSLGKSIIYFLNFEKK